METPSQRIAEFALQNFLKRHLGDRIASFTERELPDVHAQLAEGDTNGALPARVTQLVVQLGLAQDGTLFRRLQQEFSAAEVRYEIDELAALFLVPIEALIEPKPAAIPPAAAPPADVPPAIPPAATPPALPRSTPSSSTPSSARPSSRPPGARPSSRPPGMRITDPPPSDRTESRSNVPLVRSKKPKDPIDAPKVIVQAIAKEEIDKELLSAAPPPLPTIAQATPAMPPLPTAAGSATAASASSRPPPQTVEAPTAVDPGPAPVISDHAPTLPDPIAAIEALPASKAVVLVDKPGGQTLRSASKLDLPAAADPSAPESPTSGTSTSESSSNPSASEPRTSGATAAESTSPASKTKKAKAPTAKAAKAKRAGKAPAKKSGDEAPSKAKPKAVAAEKKAAPKKKSASVLNWPMVAAIIVLMFGAGAVYRYMATPDSPDVSPAVAATAAPDPAANGVQAPVRTATPQPPAAAAQPQPPEPASSPEPATSPEPAANTAAAPAPQPPRGPMPPVPAPAPDPKPTAKPPPPSGDFYDDLNAPAPKPAAPKPAPPPDSEVYPD